MAHREPVVTDEMQVVACDIETFEKDRGIESHSGAGCIVQQVHGLGFCCSRERRAGLLLCRYRPHLYMGKVPYIRIA